MATAELESLKIHGNVRHFLKKQESLKENLLKIISKKSKKQKKLLLSLGNAIELRLTHKMCA